MLDTAHLRLDIVFGPVYNSNATTLSLVTDKTTDMYGTTMMLTAMANALIAHSLTSEDPKAGIKTLHKQASMFEFVMEIIETEDSPNFTSTCMVLSKCYYCLLINLLSVNLTLCSDTGFWYCVHASQLLECHLKDKAKWLDDKTPNRGDRTNDKILTKFILCGLNVELLHGYFVIGVFLHSLRIFFLCHQTCTPSTIVAKTR